MPGTEQPPDGDELSQVVRVVIGHQQYLAQHRLPLAVRQRGEQIRHWVEMLINRTLSGYVVSVRGERINPVAPIDRPDSSDPVNQNATAAA